MTDEKRSNINRTYDGVTISFIHAGTFKDEDGNDKDFQNSIKISNGKDRDRDGKPVRMRVSALFIKSLIRGLQNEPEITAFVTALLQEEKVRKLAEYEQ